MAGTTRLAPGRTTIVRPASALSRRRSTRSSCAPNWSLAPSCSAVAAEMATPSTSVPALEPASSIRAPPPLPPSEIRACTRETRGSASMTVLPGARPIVTSPRSGTRVRSARTSSSGAAAPATGAPQAPQSAAARESRRRQRVQSMGLSQREWLEGGVVAREAELLPLGRLADRHAHELPVVLLASGVSHYHDDVYTIGAPGCLAGAHALRLGFGEREVGGLAEVELEGVVLEVGDERGALAVG